MFRVTLPFAIVLTAFFRLELMLSQNNPLQLNTAKRLKI